MKTLFENHMKASIAMGAQYLGTLLSLPFVLVDMVTMTLLFYPVLMTTELSSVDPKHWTEKEIRSANEFLNTVDEHYSPSNNPENLRQQLLDYEFFLGPGESSLLRSSFRFEVNPDKHSLPIFMSLGFYIGALIGAIVGLIVGLLTFPLRAGYNAASSLTSHSIFAPVSMGSESIDNTYVRQ